LLNSEPLPMYKRRPVIWRPWPSIPSVGIPKPRWGFGGRPGIAWRRETCQRLTLLLWPWVGQHSISAGCDSPHRLRPVDPKAQAAFSTKNRDPDLVRQSNDAAVARPAPAGRGFLLNLRRANPLGLGPVLCLEAGISAASGVPLQDKFGIRCALPWVAVPPHSPRSRSLAVSAAWRWLHPCRGRMILKKRGDPDMV